MGQGSTMIFGMPAPLAGMLFAGLFGLGLILTALLMLMRRKADPLERLNAARPTPSTSAATAATAAAGGQPGRLRQGRGNDKLHKYATFLEPKDAQQMSEIRTKLLQAGYRSRAAVRYFNFAQFVLGLAGLALGAGYYLLAAAKGAEMGMQETLLYILGPGGMGYLTPRYWVTKRQQERQKEIQSGFPDALDMMLVCIEAGQSIDQAVLRVARELRASYPALADEFEIVSHEVKAGKDKPAVLRDMAERCGVPDISSFVTVLIQSSSFGTSIADALRVYASEMRDKRVMRAEEAANKLPTKMTLVTMTLTVPPLLIILVAPSLHNITTMGGQ